jgi:hypoxanthine phosphoribosyltransferase
MPMPKWYFSWKDIEHSCLFIKQCLDSVNFKPDYIVGLTRGGLIPAVMLSHMTGIKVVVLDASFRDSNDIPESNLWLPEEATFNDKKILIIDDINDTGTTFNWIIEDWNRSALGKCDWSNIKFAALVHNKASKASTDFTFLIIDKSVQDIWIVYPWEQNE